MSLPTLKAVILDFSSVNNVDVTSIQILIDVRNQLDRWAAPDPVDWHFACITNRWTKRALIAAGFGYPSPVSDNIARWKPIFNITEIGGSQSAAAAAEERENKRRKRSMAAAAAAAAAENQQQQQPPHAHNNDGGEAGLRSMSVGSGVSGYAADESKRSAVSGSGGGFQVTTKTKIAVVHGINRPLFHIDLPSALRAAIHNVEECAQRE
jgi:sodium-independent sulfate anion transporter 11